MRVDLASGIAETGFREVSPRLECLGDERFALLGARRFTLDRI